MSKIDPGVQKCIAALQAAKNDTEKMAALFLVTKIVKAAKLDSANRNALFNAITFKFILHLLNSSSTEECPELLYKSVALNILTAFCAEPSIAEAKEMQEAIPIFLKIVERASENPDDDQLLMVTSDAYHCLKCVASTERGALGVVKSQAVPKLIEVYTKHDSEDAAEVLKLVAAKVGARTWDGCSEAFHQLMDRVSLQFEADQSEQKFVLAGQMAAFLGSTNVGASKATEYFWPASVLHGLTDMLTSKLTDSQREPSLKLASTLFTTFGTEWIINNSEDKDKCIQFIVLLIHLSCVEIRVTLENQKLDRILAKNDLLGSVYGILEKSVTFISGPHFEASLDDKQRENVFTSLKGSAGAILQFVSLLRKESEKNDKFWNAKNKLLACASIRALASLLAEESVSLKDDVYKQLPFVLNLVSEDYQDAELNQSVEAMTLAEMGKSTEALMPDILCTLLPALCHLTAAEKGVSIVSEAKTDELLFKFVNHNWSVYKNIKELLEKMSRPKKERKGKKEEGSSMSEGELKQTLFRLRIALTNATNIFLNISVLNPDFISTSATFQQVMRWAFGSLPTLTNPQEELVLLANVSSLGLILLLDATKKASGQEKLSPEEEFQASRLMSGTDNTVFRFGQSVVRFIWDAHLPDESQSPASLEITSDYRAVWSDIKEMWFLSLQTLGSLMQVLQWLADFCCESGFLEAIIGNLAKAYKNRIDQSTLAAYEDFLCIALQGGERASGILRTKGAALAQSHHLRGLKKALTGEAKE